MISDLLVFRMYRQFIWKRSRALEKRKLYGPAFKRNRTGIAVDDDKYALQWQRWNQLVIVTEKYLERKLARSKEIQEFNAFLLARIAYLKAPEVAKCLVALVRK